MAKLELNVITSVLSKTNQETIVDDSIDFWGVDVTFSEDWSDKTKTLIAGKGNEKYAWVLVDDKIAETEHFNLSAGRWVIGIVGISGTGVVNNTTPLYIDVAQGGYQNGEIPPIPDHDVYLQLLELYQELISGGGSGYILPTMTDLVKGGAKVGNNLLMTEEALGLNPDLQDVERIHLKDMKITPPANLQVGDLWREDGHAYYKVSDDSVLDLGRELYQIVQNNTGSLIENGSIVYETGSVGASENMRASKFLADGNTDWLRVIGIATEDIPNGEEGNVTVFGAIGSLNTSAISAGSRIYASGTVAGQFTGTAPDYAVAVGSVLRSHATTGIVFIRTVHLEIENATTSKDGLMSATDKTKLDGLSNYTLPTASETVKGGIKVGTNLSINVDGVLSSQDTTYTAGDGINITENVISIDYPATYIEVPDATTITQELVPNVFYKFLTLTTCTSLTLTLDTGIETQLNVYSGRFTTGATPPTFTTISGVAWSGGFPTLVGNKTYEFSIIEEIGLISEMA